MRTKPATSTATPTRDDRPGRPPRAALLERVVGLALVNALAGFAIGCDVSTLRDDDEARDAGSAAPAAAEPHETAPQSADPTTGATRTATATLQSAPAHDIAGTVRFEQSGAQVTVIADLTGLPPGEHGIHVHENGDCGHPEFETAGGHFNPSNMPHGAPASGMHHAGDLGNLTATEQGTASYRLSTTDLTLEEGDGDRSVVGRALIVHEGADDFAAQPDGAAGARIACGVIEAAPTS
jgi:Cu-Zn family superoxide dismutase